MALVQVETQGPMLGLIFWPSPRPGRIYASYSSVLAVFFDARQGASVGMHSLLGREIPFPIGLGPYGETR